MRIYRLKFYDNAILASVYIMEYKRFITIRSSRAITDFMLEHNLANPVKSIYENIRGRLHEHQYRYMTLTGMPIQSSKGGPRTSFNMNPVGMKHLKTFYEASEAYKNEIKYRSPIEGQPCADPYTIDNNILKL